MNETVFIFVKTLGGVLSTYTKTRAPRADANARRFVLELNVIIDVIHISAKQNHI